MSDTISHEGVEDQGYEAPENDALAADQAQERDEGSDEGESEDQQRERARLNEDQSRKVALRRERQRARDAEARAKQLEERLNALESGKQTRNEPDPFAKLAAAKDPLSEIDALRDIALSMAQQREQDQRRAQATAQQQARFKEISDAMTEFEDDFRLSNPDYDGAAKHFSDARRLELEEMGYSGDQLQEALRNDLVGLVDRSVRSGKDPAETVYKLAKARGYGVDGARAKLDTIARGVAAGASIGKVGAKSQGGKLTVEAVGKMEGEEFRKNFQKLKAQMMRQRA